MSFFSLKNNLFAVPLRYGVIGGGFAILLFLIFYFLDMNPLANIKMVDMFLLAIFIFFALKEFRDRYNNRQLHFWQGMSGGVITYLAIAIISAIFILIMTVIIEPDMTTKYIDGLTKLLIDNRQSMVETINEESYAEALAGVAETTPFDLALDDFLKKSMIGLFLTIIIAVILRK